jgi:hypothetical protein
MNKIFKKADLIYSQVTVKNWQEYFGHSEFIPENILFNIRRLFNC